jgi:FMN-dependent NADH-azoreductase
MSSPCADVTRILHVIASPKGPESSSTQIANAFLDECRRLDPDTDVSVLDLWGDDLPPFGRDAAIAKLAPLVGESLSPAQELAWIRVTDVIADFASYDKIVISTPMWNFSVPYALKHYIDLLVQPGITFGLNDAFEHVGLLADRPVQLILTRSSAFAEGSPEDFQLSYLRHVLEFIGLEDVRALLAEGTTLPAEARAAFIEEKCVVARAAASEF